MIAETIKATTQGNEGARRATEIPRGGTEVATIPDPEVPTKATRRRFTSEYKRRILKEADACTDLGALLRREGLYCLEPRHLAQADEPGCSDRPFSKRGRTDHRYSKKAAHIGGPALDPRGRRERLMDASLSLSPEVGIRPAYESLGVSRAAFYRKRKKQLTLDVVLNERRRHPRALSPEKRQDVLDILDSDRFVAP